MKCITCHYLDEKVIKTEDGNEEVRPFCYRTGKELPSYDYNAKGCLGYSMSAEYREKYED